MVLAALRSMDLVKHAPQSRSPEYALEYAAGAAPHAPHTAAGASRAGPFAPNAAAVVVAAAAAAAPSNPPAPPPARS